MRTRKPVVAVAVLGFLAMGSACSSTDGDDERVYSVADVESFQPESLTYNYETAFSLSAGEAWQEGWPDELKAVMQPPECLSYLTSIEMLLETDDSETAYDSTVFISGYLSDELSGADGAVYVKARVFSSPAAARAFLSGLRTSAVSCATGYTYTLEGLTWTVGSIDVSDVDLAGAKDLVRIEEGNVSYGVDGEAPALLDTYTHYIHVQGNVAFIASYAFAGGSVFEADAADLIRQFIDHLG